MLHWAFLISSLSIVSCKTVILSLDGFRWDYISRYGHLLINFDKMVSEGVFVENGLVNAFITKTFPNHRTLITGLWEETHGIISNGFQDTVLNATFAMSSLDPKWWLPSVPLWKHAEDHNITSGCFQYPACEVVPQRPTHSLGIPYDQSVTFNSLVDNVTQSLYRSTSSADLAVFYYYEPDHTGHYFGPSSDEVRSILIELDGYVGRLLSGLDSNTNLIILSDHGMADIPTKEFIVFPDHVNMSTIERVEYTACEVLIWPADEELLMVDLMILLEKFEGLRVYHKEEFPLHWHYRFNSRIPPILLVAPIHVTIWGSNGGPSYATNKTTIGQHGYDNNLLEMHPVFIGYGPAFRKGYRHYADVYSVDIFSLACQILGIPQRETNGSLARVLPLLAEYESRHKESVGEIFLASNLVLTGLLILLILFGLYNATQKETDYKYSEVSGKLDAHEDSA